jgi:hypothetical protein
MLFGELELESVAVSRAGFGARHLEQVAEFRKEGLAVGALRGRGRRPTSDESVDVLKSHS